MVDPLALNGFDATRRHYRIISDDFQQVEDKIAKEHQRYRNEMTLYLATEPAGRPMHDHGQAHDEQKRNAPCRKEASASSFCFEKKTTCNKI